jgi:N-acetyl-beta-hexosaminidase
MSDFERMGHNSAAPTMGGIVPEPVAVHPTPGIAYSIGPGTVIEAEPGNSQAMASPATWPASCGRRPGTPYPSSQSGCPGRTGPSRSPAIIGVEAPVWTETMSTLAEIEYMAFPRLAALAELAWSPWSTHDWNRFRVCLGAQAPLWTQLGINYYHAPEIPWN